MLCFPRSQKRDLGRPANLACRQLEKQSSILPKIEMWGTCFSGQMRYTHPPTRTHPIIIVGGSMIDPREAFLILHKWADEKTLIVCQCKFRDAAFSLTGVVSSLKEGKCEIKSRKGEAILQFLFNAPECSFEYVERRAGISSDAPEEFAERAHLLIFLPPSFSLEEFETDTTAGRDSLTISELHDSEIKSVS